ncbi:MAG: uncharacterized protein QOF78_3278 [Phycisphaerales bacterium]|jgi:uncharacterized Tic20 family protein|nr:uncharacterized protein [Phycisphaerales bacterium]
MSEPTGNPPPDPSSVPPPPPPPGEPGQSSFGTPGAIYSGPAPTQDDRTMAMLAHLGGILFGFLGPLIIWLIKKDQSPFVDDQGKEALNFQITLLIGYAIGGATTFVCIGFVILPVVWIAGLIFGIMGAMAANKGEAYRYPFNIRFIK